MISNRFYDYSFWRYFFVIYVWFKNNLLSKIFTKITWISIKIKFSNKMWFFQNKISNESYFRCYICCPQNTIYWTIKPSFYSLSIWNESHGWAGIPFFTNILAIVIERFRTSSIRFSCLCLSFPCSFWIQNESKNPWFCLS